MRRPVAEILARAALGIRPLLAIAVATGVGPLVAEFAVLEFAVLESSRRATLIAVTVVALGPRRAIVAIEARAIPARLEIALLAASTVIPIPARRPVTTVTARWTIIPAEALRTLVVAIEAARRSIVIPAARRTVIAVAGIRALATVAFEFFRPKAARFEFSGELLLRPPRLARAALAARRTVAPAAGGVIFVIVAGHESLTSGLVKNSRARPLSGRISRKTGLDFC
jgi:hypothetical protein